MSALRLVDSPRALVELVRDLRGSEWLTVDTEFLSERSYTPRFCLLQIANEDVVACVDVLQPLDLEPLWELLRDQAITKVFHAAENDLAVLLPVCGEVLSPVFDSQIAAALVGHGETIGYAVLVKRLLDIELDKSLARTDWSRRPLPGPALEYAAGDVIHLRDLYRQLDDALVAAGRSEWAAEEFARVCEPSRYREDPSEAWRRVRNHRDLDGQALSILRECAQWRELEARSSNRPRRWVLSDEALVGIARRAPRDEARLNRIRGFDPNRHGAFRQAILKLVEVGLSQAETTAALPAHLGYRQAAIAEVCRGLVRVAAGEAELPPNLLASSSDLALLVQGEDNVALQSGWRRELIGSRIERFLAGELRLSVESGELRLRASDELPD